MSRDVHSLFYLLSACWSVSCILEILENCVRDRETVRARNNDACPDSGDSIMLQNSRVLFFAAPVRRDARGNSYIHRCSSHRRRRDVKAESLNGKKLRARGKSIAARRRYRILSCNTCSLACR